MSRKILKYLPVLVAVAVMSCSNDDESSSVATTVPEPAEESASPETPKPEESSLFSPISAAHEKNMEQRKEEAAEIERRIEAAAKVRDAEFLVEVKAKLVEYKSHYASQYAEQIQSSVTQYRTDLQAKYLETLKQNYDAAQAGGMTVLAQQIAEEGKRLKAGQPVPRPPAESDQANPGMQLLFDLRKWYHDGAASIDESKRTSEAALTEAYRNTLAEYHGHVSQMSPPEAAEAVANALAEVKGDWWTQ
tara:strand:- start:3591 stop:4334 length:744 start_codon:yes stop_codon:yes gene_type:complete